MRHCPKCDRDLPDENFYLHWKVPPSACRKCYRKGVNLQKLSAAEEAGDLEKVARTKTRRAQMDARGPQPEGHFWCGGCSQWKPLGEFSEHSLRMWGQCKSCASAYSVRRAMLLKKRAIEFLGSRCARCGWSGHWAGYDFHHHDPSNKEIGWGGSGLRKKSWDKIVPELLKCKLLCRNCHSTIHASLDNDGNPNPEYVPVNTKS